jgi:hypothetical protein
MKNSSGSPRRAFLKSAALVAGAANASAQLTPEMPAPAPPKAAAAPARAPAFTYPRTFEGENLAMIAFPLGGVAAGSVAFGGRGQLRDWEMFNRPNKGYRPAFSFASIYAQTGSAKPVARVLESRILPPYEGASGLGSENVPGSAASSPQSSPANIRWHASTSPIPVLPVSRVTGGVLTDHSARSGRLRLACSHTPLPGAQHRSDTGDRLHRLLARKPDHLECKERSHAQQHVPQFGSRHAAC